MYKIPEKSLASKEKFLEEVQSILVSSEEGIYSTCYQGILINKQAGVFLHRNEEPNISRSILELLESPPPSPQKEVIYQLAIALPNLQVTLTLDLEASPHNRQDLIELAADALLSYPSITQLKHSGLKPEEIATLTQRCINQEVGIAEQEGKMLPAEEIADSPPCIYSSSPFSEESYEGVTIELVGANDHTVDYN